jgi:hypothetical protein
MMMRSQLHHDIAKEAMQSEGEEVFLYSISDHLDLLVIMCITE